LRLEGIRGAKVDVPNSNTTKILAFGWYVVRRRSKNGHKQETCLKEVGLHAKKMVLTIVNMDLGDIHEH
jgi:hypothetical protein